VQLGVEVLWSEARRFAKALLGVLEGAELFQRDPSRDPELSREIPSDRERFLVGEHRFAMPFACLEEIGQIGERISVLRLRGEALPVTCFCAVAFAARFQCQAEIVEHSSMARRALEGLLVALDRGIRISTLALSVAEMK